MLFRMLFRLLHTMTPIAIAALAAGCTAAGEAARVSNAIVILRELDGEGSTLPEILKCTTFHQWAVESGSSTIEGTAVGGIATIDVNINLTFKSNLPAEYRAFTCDYTARYAIDSSDQASGGGTLLTCNGECKFKGTVVSCEDFAEALRENTCSN